MPFSRSRSIESMTRSATSWLARKAPDCQSSLSTRVVFPWSTWATIATLRRSERIAMATGQDSRVGGPCADRPVCGVRMTGISTAGPRPPHGFKNDDRAGIRSTSAWLRRGRAGTALQRPCRRMSRTQAPQLSPCSIAAGCGAAPSNDRFQPPDAGLDRPQPSRGGDAGRRLRRAGICRIRLLQRRLRRSRRGARGTGEAAPSATRPPSGIVSGPASSAASIGTPSSPTRWKRAAIRSITVAVAGIPSCDGASDQVAPPMSVVAAGTAALLQRASAASQRSACQVVVLRRRRDDLRVGVAVRAAAAGLPVEQPRDGDSRRRAEARDRQRDAEAPAGRRPRDDPRPHRQRAVVADGRRRGAEVGHERRLLERLLGRHRDGRGSGSPERAPAARP